MNRSIGGMLLGTFVLRTSTTMTGMMLTFYLADLKFSSNQVAGLHVGFYITELFGAIAFGILADVIGRKLIMLLGPAFGAIAVFLTGLTTIFPVLFVTRLLEGASTAASIPSTLGFIAVETSHDERLRGRVVAWFELLSLAGMLAVGPALGGILYDAFGRAAFFMNVGFYGVAFLFYAYGVKESPRAPAEVPHVRREVTLRRYLDILTNRRVMLFAPTWLAINAALGLWVSQAPFLLAGGGFRDPSQWLLTLDLENTVIGVGEAVLAVFIGAGILFWGNLFGNIRRTNMLLYGTAAFAVAAVDIFLINHLGGTSSATLMVLAVVLLGAIFVMSGATPAALGLLADVSEGFHQDRSAIMGFYSVFMGIGQVIGISIAGPAATWRGIDGLVLATGILIAIGLAALVNLRAHDDELAGLNKPVASGAASLEIGGVVRSTLEKGGWGGDRQGAEARAKEER